MSNNTEIKIVYNKLPEIAKRFPELVSAAVRNTAFRVERRAKTSMVGNRRGGSKLAIDTGHLANSISAKMTSATSAEVGTGDVEYAAIHEFGGIIKPTKSKFLAIPMNGAKGSPRDYADLHFVKLEGGTGLLINKDGVAKFFLTKEVHMPARPFMGPAADAEREGFMAEMKRLEGLL